MATSRLIPVGATEDFLPYGGGSVRVLRGGSGEALPLVLVHGGGSDNAAISWATVFGPLAADRSVVALDLPGFGYTQGIPITGSPDDLADFVVGVARAYGLNRAVYSGISMGGDVVMRVGLRHPEAVAGLVVVAPGGLVDQIKNPVVHRLTWLATQLPDAVLYSLARLASRFTRLSLERIVVDPEALPPDIVDEFVREARKPQAGLGYGRYNQATIGPTRMINNVLPVVFRITAPTLFLHGQDDPVVDPQGSVAAAELMPYAHVVLVPHCGHWVPVEAPGTFLAEVSTFLADITDSPRPG